MAANKKTREPVEIVKVWKDGFDNYQRNDGGESQFTNVTQEIEIDANAYGIILFVLSLITYDVVLLPQGYAKS